jgi:hypothetical protein
MNNRRRKYDIQRSSYTTRKIHKKLKSDEVIYEHDRLITYATGVSGTSPTFPMLYNENRYGKQNHNVGEWEIINNEEPKTCITQEDLNKLNTSPSENKVKINPKYRTLRNFAYFGSCVDLVETSLDNIIVLFDGKTPSEIEEIKKTANLSEFEEYMLNTENSPKYTMVLDYYYDSEIGVQCEERKFTFPTTIDKKTNIEVLDFTSEYFNDYYNKLIDLAEFHDAKQTDNMWRMMTHDSIKNMDFTFVKNDDDVYDYADGTTKMNKIIHAIGRQFDTLKLYIDNIKFTNNISYDDYSSMPDYILSDKLELAGWEVCSVAPDNQNKQSNDVNIKFMRNLLMDSKNILTRKGTKHGINMLLSLFGLTPYEVDNLNYDYKIDEQVYVANSFRDGSGEENIISGVVPSNRYLNVEKYNSWKTSFDEDPEGETDELQGLPLSIVITGTTENELKYIIPWFDRTAQIDGEPYFEMSGGWFHLPKKIVSNRISGGFNSLTLHDNDNLPIYNESINRLNIISDLQSLSMYGSYSQWIKVNNAVCYVTDISDFDSKYDEGMKYNGSYIQGSDNHIGWGQGMKTPSHYFILKDVENSSTIGRNPKNIGKDESGNFIIEDDTEIRMGWINIPEEDFQNDKLTEDAKRVLYVESIKDDHKGNKPHRGDKFDDGSSYKNLFERIFGYSIDNDKTYSRSFIDVAYECDTDEIKQDIINCGFNIETQKDNVKVHYFTDTTYNGTKYTETGDLLYETNLNPHNFEDSKSTWGESADYSVINSKQMTITFSENFINNDESYNYFIKCIMPYLEQVIPSSALVKIECPGLTLS